MLKVNVVDYGASNLLNVVNALRHLGVDLKVVNTEKEIREANRLILPGVGAFRAGMNSLEDKKLIPAILDFIQSERPYLGICLGMQFLFARSYEFGLTEGLGVFQGEVAEIPTGFSELTRRVPHIGWSSIHGNPDKLDSPLFRNLDEGQDFYFVHSFMCIPQNDAIISSKTNYEGLEIPASVSYNNVHGTQFHPEKSGKAGLQVLQNFLNM
jgi:glutamine amidotransferase